MRRGWLVGIGGAVIAAVGTLAALGLAQPAEHEVTRTIVIARPPAEVWHALADSAAQLAWRDDLRALERLPDRDGHPVWREVSRDGDALPLEVIEAVPPVRLVRRIADSTLPFAGEWRFRLAYGAGGTELTVTEAARIPNPLLRAIMRYGIGYETSLERFLQRLAAHLGAPPPG